jgi:hypothetical protein
VLFVKHDVLFHKYVKGWSKIGVYLGSQATIEFNRRLNLKRDLHKSHTSQRHWKKNHKTDQNLLHSFNFHSFALTNPLAWRENYSLSRPISQEEQAPSEDSHSGTWARILYYA